MRTKLVCPVVLSFFLVAGCSGGGSQFAGGSGVVHAQGFSNANLVGSYAFRYTGIISFTSLEVGTGVFTVDGAGRITSGTLTLNLSGVGISTCQFTFSGGSYSVNADGTGVATFVLNPAPSCSSFSSTNHWSIALASGGARVEFIWTDPGSVFSGTATKQ